MSPVTPLQAVGYKRETTYGLFVTPDQFMPATSAEIQTTQKVERMQVMMANRGQRQDDRIGIETGVSISSDLYPEGYTGMVAGSFGVGSDSVSGSAGVGFTHAMTPKNDLPSWSVELATDWATQLLSRQVPGCMVDTLTMRAQAQALMSLEIGLIGQTERTPATPGLPSFATPTYRFVDPLDFSQVAFSYGGATNLNLMEATLGISNGVQRVFTSNQSLYVRRLVPTRRNVTLTAGFDFVDLTQFNDWRNSVIIPGFQVVATGPQIQGASGFHSVAFNVRRLRAMDTFNLGSNSDVLNAQLTFSSTYGVFSEELTATIVNGESAAGA